MIRTLLATAALVSATEAAALSCLVPDPARRFAEAQASETEYAVLNGTFTFDQSRMPEAMLGEAPPAAPEPVQARFSGNVLTPEGFTQGYEGTVSLIPSCAGPWCGTLESPAQALSFVEVTDEGLTLRIDACRTDVFTDPSRETLVRIVSCMQGAGCEPLSE
ncbi:hypothetical protein [Histidinibacterium aquaticum]|uniref:Uncharacterized protein n=1 Tax=Histidinibacterium aquaticum TaxID=2613962 RepID=A0A5J5GD66_9RHOB|nr:hypothetical protein [Histidinibacterium aquaticum]KAA9006139.1 hypothetical protein F3S47_16480 [Histidinibacterium aquaticum]